MFGLVWLVRRGGCGLKLELVAGDELMNEWDGAASFGFFDLRYLESRRGRVTIWNRAWVFFFPPLSFLVAHTYTGGKQSTLVRLLLCCFFVCACVALFGTIYHDDDCALDIRCLLATVSPDTSSSFRLR
ncbi:hypothetical protein F5144DRAFT_365807 [Chaetomium tenue]|uniref:Uncharacterized protein n=1 Tax=Chaetomium tenue TaxID=1854479 RepID=A0ACB7NYN1_9PEZI|nr:hypothetical protein F5144DRAFT_365807 [Chaetomium globosum]